MVGAGKLVWLRSGSDTLLSHHPAANNHAASPLPKPETSEATSTDKLMDTTRVSSLPVQKPEASARRDDILDESRRQQEPAQPRSRVEETLQSRKAALARSTMNEDESMPKPAPKLQRTGRVVRFSPEILLLDYCNNGIPEGQNSTETVRTLLAQLEVEGRQADVNHICTPGKKNSVLQLACGSNQLAVARFFITECGARVNIRDTEGWTPLHSAVYEGNQNMIRFLCAIQRKPGEGLNPDETCAVDAPIDLWPKTVDGENPEEILIQVEDDDQQESAKATIAIIKGKELRPSLARR